MIKESRTALVTRLRTDVDQSYSGRNESLARFATAPMAKELYCSELLSIGHELSRNSIEKQELFTSPLGISLGFASNLKGILNPELTVLNVIL